MWPSNVALHDACTDDGNTVKSIVSNDDRIELPSRYPFVLNDASVSGTCCAVTVNVLPIAHWY